MAAVEGLTAFAFAALKPGGTCFALDDLAGVPCVADDLASPPSPLGLRRDRLRSLRTKAGLAFRALPLISIALSMANKRLSIFCG